MAIDRTLQAAELELAQKLKAQKEQLKAQRELAADISRLKDVITLIKAKTLAAGSHKNGNGKRKLLVDYIVEILQNGPLRIPDLIEELHRRGAKLSRKNPNGSIIFAMKKMGHKFEKLNGEYRLTQGQ